MIASCLKTARYLHTHKDHHCCSSILNCAFVRVVQINVKVKLFHNSLVFKIIKKNIYMTAWRNKYSNSMKPCNILHVFNIMIMLCLPCYLKLCKFNLIHRVRGYCFCFHCSTFPSKLGLLQALSINMKHEFRMV